MKFRTAMCTASAISVSSLSAAQVSNVSLTFEVDVPDLIDINTGNSLGNESFVDQGGLELLPYSRSAMGGLGDIVGSVSLNAELTGDGQFSGTGSNSATDQLIKPSDALSRTTMDFTVSGSLDYAFDYNAFFDNDGGSYSAVLTGPNGTVFASQPLFPGDNDEMFSGTLPAGEYQLVTFAQSRGSVNYSFSIVPAPGSAALLGVAGLAVTRRRR